MPVNYSIQSMLFGKEHILLTYLIGDAAYV